MGVTTHHPLTNGGLDLSSVEALPDNPRGQRVVILITLATAFPLISVTDFQEPLGWSSDEMRIVLEDTGSIIDQLEIAR